jgi:hypothetical protein
MENNDDTRKKRDSKEVVDEGSVVVNEEKSKKLRAAANTGRNESETSISQHDVPEPVLPPSSSTPPPPPPPSVQSDQASASIGDGSRPATSATTASVPEVSNQAVTANNQENNVTIAVANGNALDFNVKEGALDLEVALHRIVRMNEKSDIKEYLSTSNPTSWVTFRVGHAGDASTLAACYRKSQAVITQSTVQGDGGATATTTSTTVQCATKSPVNSREYDNSANNSINQADKRSSTETHPGTIYAATTVGGTTVEDTSLEIRLAEGLGDEDTPPCIFALLAEVESFKEPDVRHLGAASLLSIAWQDGVKVLQVEWLYVSAFPTEGGDVDGSHFPTSISDLLERRMWLRLSALVMMTGCQVLQAPNQNGSRCNVPPKPDKTGPPSSPDAVAGAVVAPTPSR